MVEQVLQSLAKFLPETTLAATICVAILAGIIVRSRPRLPLLIAFLGVGLSMVFSVQEMGTSQSLFSGMLAVDPFAIFFKIIVGACALIIILFSLYSAEVRIAISRMTEYSSLLVAMTLGMYLMAGATNLLMIVLSIELTGLSSYVLAGYTKEAPDSSEAALKYIIYGALSTGLMLYGISILFGLTGGATDLYSINRALSSTAVNPIALLVATLLIIAGLGYKISAVPFHFWTPDVYEGAPVTITAFLSVASKAAGFAILIRFFKVSFIDANAMGLPAGFWAIVQGFEWNKIIAILSVLTMTLGNLVAVWQNNMKRLLAYSSIAHAGYMLMGVVVLSDKGLAAVMVYFVVYLLMNLGAFYVVMLVANKTGSEDIDSYRGLGYRTPLVSVAMVVFLISLAGIPPTAGFIGKLFLFASLLDAQWIWLAIVGAINSVISLYYYVRIVRNMFLRDPEGDASPIQFSVPQVAILLLLAIPTLVFGLYYSPIVELANASVMMFGVR
ncbi:MAG TPA: NADH-quinone oxidoreductase subunit N [Bacteroidetes bacterium]|nr:MAG: NADH dehydrogenase [Ignavibacteria bacterium GWA2_54_16]HCA80400.1 NADH-quinone oxidoreductase subunit N [Bacteroidota bacterium]